jgi:cytochrome c-type biogenesis protein CcmH
MAKFDANFLAIRAWLLRSRVIAGSAIAIILMIAIVFFESRARSPIEGDSSSISTPVNAQELAEALKDLVKRVADRPNDAEAWALLARSESLAGRLDEAYPAYRRAIDLSPNDADLLADYADAIAVRSGFLSVEAEALLKRALDINPSQPKALYLAGAFAFHQGNYDSAILRWDSLTKVVPENTQLARQVRLSLAEARRRLASRASPG